MIVAYAAQQLPGEFIARQLAAPLTHTTGCDTIEWCLAGIVLNSSRHTSRGWLAQPAERVVHTDEVTGSSPVPPTKPATLEISVHIAALSSHLKREGARFFSVQRWRAEPNTKRPLRAHHAVATSHVFVE